MIQGQKNERTQDNVISEKIFELILRNSITQKEFSEKTGISQSTISDWKRKGTNPIGGQNSEDLRSAEGYAIRTFRGEWNRTKADGS